MSNPKDGDDNLVGDWSHVVRAIDAVQHAATGRLEAIDVPLPYFWVLTLLADADGQRMPMSRIARDLAMTSGGFTKLADRMARDGLIDRRGSSGDRRVVFAALTDAGSELAARASEVYRRFLREEVLGLVSRDDLASLASIATRLAAIGAAEPEADTSFELAPRPADAPERRGRR